jgi:small-conductance mechanosensitive channel
MRIRTLILPWLLGILALPALAATGIEAATPTHPDHAANHELVDTIHLAPVMIDGATLFQVRGITAYPAEKRAADIAGRIIGIARDPAVSTDSIRVAERPQGSAILAGERHLMTVFDADARIDAIDRPIVAQAYARNIASAIVRYRGDREPQALARGAGYSAGALAALAVWMYGLWRLHRRISAILEGRYRTRLEHLHIQGFKVLHAEQLWGGLRKLIDLAHVLLALTGVYLALHFILQQFPGSRWLASDLLDMIATPLLTMGTGLVNSIPSLIFLLILVLVTRYVLKTLRLFFGAVEQGSVKLAGFDAEWSWPTYRIIRLLVIAFALVVAYPYIPGSNSDAFKGISIFLGVIFSLGSSSIIANIIAGYSMTYRRAFRVGDRIQVGDVLGDVSEVRLQVTHVRSPKNEEIVIPNSLILNSNVTNYSTLARSRGLILHTTVGIGYDTPWRQVEAMLLLAASRTPGALREPAPFILQKALGDFAVTYELNAYCDRPAEMNRIYTDLHRNILDVFNEYGVAIMTPAYEGDPEQPKLVARDQWYAEPARAPEAHQGGEGQS